jgi:hypothetical protein
MRDNGAVISVELSLRLRVAGLPWSPAPGDRFVIRRPLLMDQPFVLSDMTVDVHDFPTGRVLGFNGTVEWALDAIEIEQTVWLPNEHQLREHLGPSFERLERVGGGYRVVLAGPDAASFEHADAAEAYGQALLHMLTHRHSPAPA